MSGYLCMNRKRVIEAVSLLVKSSCWCLFPRQDGVRRPNVRLNYGQVTTMQVPLLHNPSLRYSLLLSAEMQGISLC